MPLNRDDLAKIQTRAVPLGARSAEAPRSIHLAPGVREWVTLETLALPPIPTRRDAGWRLVSLLATPYQRDAHGRILSFHAPWGYIEWAWPDLTATSKVKFDEALGEAQRWRVNDPALAAAPPGEVAPLTPEQLVAQERSLYAALDRLLDGDTVPTPPELARLAQLYAHALPEGAYRYYWLIIPECRAWLQPRIALPDAPTLPQTPTLTQTLPRTPAFSDETTEIDADWSVSPPPGTDSVAAQLAGWITQAKRLAEGAKASDIVAALDHMETRAQAPGFRLAFIGEFNRGKSTLLNRLFGRNLLPVGDVPVTSTITSIVAGTPEKLHVHFPDGRTEDRPLTPNAWNDLIADAQAESTTRFPQVRVTIADPWLTSLDAEVVDTPGAGDLVEQRVALIYEVLGQSDAAVLLVSAHVPFSLTERTFLEEQVLGRHIARVLVVVSHLDAVPSEERESVLQAVRTRVGKVSPEIPVVASFPASVSSSGEAALTRVRDAITRLANHSDRRLWRSRQLAEQLTDQLTGLVELGHLALEAISASDAERATLLSRQRTAEREASLAWEKVGAELDQRAFAVEQTLRQRIGETRDDMVEQLLYDLQRSPNPKMWWEQDLPYLLHRQLIGIGRNSEALVLARVNQDMDWLRVAATRQLGGATNALVTTIDARGLRAGEAHFKQLPLRDLQRVRLFTRIGCGAATVATYLFFAPLGIAAGISSTILSEQLVNKQVEQQRQLVRRHVEAAVGAVVAGYLQQVTSRVRYLYQDVAQELQQAAESRDHSKTAVLALPDTGANRAAWEQLIAAAMGLRETIVLALGN